MVASGGGVSVNAGKATGAALARILDCKKPLRFIFELLVFEARGFFSPLFFIRVLSAQKYVRKVILMHPGE